MSTSSISDISSSSSSSEFLCFFPDDFLVRFGFLYILSVTTQLAGPLSLGFSCCYLGRLRPFYGMKTKDIGDLKDCSEKSWGCDLEDCLSKITSLNYHIMCGEFKIFE